ncbi:MAG: dehydrogenase [Chloroflexi bacterium]|nr:MAG: dehydrogenase [Chloroflexota bacterium]
MKVALIGTGRIGEVHGQLLGAQPGVQLIVSDADPDRARTSAARLGAETAAGVEEAFDGADAAVIAASTDAHARLVSMAVDRGIPTFVEKPLAFDLPQTEALVDKIESSGVPVQVGFQRRFDAGYREARRMVESGELGVVYLVRLIAHDHQPPPDAYIPISGGLFRDSSIHDFDSLRWLTGQEVEELHAVGTVRAFPVFARHHDVDTAAVVLRLRDGTIALLGQTRHDPRGYDVRVELIGSRDAVSVGLGPNTPLRPVEREPASAIGAGWTGFLGRFEAAYRAELLAFLRVVAGEQESECTARDALEAMRISVAATRSRLDGRPVMLADLGAREQSAAVTVPASERGGEEAVGT